MWLVLTEALLLRNRAVFGFARALCLRGAHGADGDVKAARRGSSAPILTHRSAASFLRDAPCVRPLSAQRQPQNPAAASATWCLQRETITPVKAETIHAHADTHTHTCARTHTHMHTHTHTHTHTHLHTHWCFRDWQQQEVNWSLFTADVYNNRSQTRDQITQTKVLLHNLHIIRKFCAKVFWCNDRGPLEVSGYIIIERSPAKNNRNPMVSIKIP